MARKYVEKIIDGKLYDTRKARIHQFECYVSICVTKKGAYFLAKFNEDTITPMTREEAVDMMKKRWGEEAVQGMLAFETAQDA